MRSFCVGSQLWIPSETDERRCVARHRNHRPPRGQRREKDNVGWSDNDNNSFQETTVGQRFLFIWYSPLHYITLQSITLHFLIDNKKMAETETKAEAETDATAARKRQREPTPKDVEADKKQKGEEEADNGDKDPVIPTRDGDGNEVLFAKQGLVYRPKILNATEASQLPTVGRPNVTTDKGENGTNQQGEATPYKDNDKSTSTETDKKGAKPTGIAATSTPEDIATRDKEGKEVMYAKDGLYFRPKVLNETEASQLPLAHRPGASGANGKKSKEDKEEEDPKEGESIQR